MKRNRPTRPSPNTEPTRVSSEEAIQPAPASFAPPTRLPDAWPLLVLLIAGMVIYRSSLGNDFVFDDVSEIEKSPHIRQLDDLYTLMFDGRSLPARPIPYLTFGLNYAYHGLDKYGYHITNLAIHIACASLIYALVAFGLSGLDPSKKISTEATTFVALTAALLWMAHPLCTQAVTYIYQRIESISALFMLATLWFLRLSATSRLPWVWQAAAILSSCLGMASKEHVVVLPIWAIWFDRVFLSGSWKELWNARGGFHVLLMATWAVLFAVLWITFADYGELNPSESHLKHSALDHLLTQPRVLLWYLRLSFWPFPQVLEYEWGVTPKPEFWILPGLVIVGALVATAWMMWKAPKMGFVVGSFFLLLAPTSSIVPVLATCAEHRMYLPLASVVVCVVVALFLGFKELFAKISADTLSVAVLVLAAPFVFLLGYATHLRNGVYETRKALWLDTIEKSPHSFIAADMCVKRLTETAPTADDKLRARKIAEEYQRTAGGPMGWLFLGIVEFDDDKKAAEAHFKRAIEENPALYQAHYWLGELYTREGRDEEAEHYFEQALRYSESYSEAWNNLGRIKARRGDTDQAIRCFKKALDVDISNAQAHYNLAFTYMNQGKKALALPHAREAALLAPDDEQFQRFYAVIQRN